MREDMKIVTVCKKKRRFTLNLEALQDELKVIIIRFFDFQGIDSVDSEKVRKS